MSLCVDLHTHSNASDGTDSPGELIDNAHKAGLRAVAITDHDTLGGLKEAKKACAAYDNLDFVRGVEISTGSSPGDMHLLGLWVPEDAEPLEKVLAKMRAKRTSRNERMVERIAALGVGITMDDVMKEAKGESVGRPHIARAIVAKGYVRDINEAFARYVGAGCPTYIAKEVMQPEDAVALLAKIGASPVLAHPMLKPYPPGWIEEFVKKLLPFGLCGIEAWHSEHTDEDTQDVLAIARRYHLCVSGGSDYHGSNKPHISLGTGYGSLCVSVDAYERLRAWRLEHNLPC